MEQNGFEGTSLSLAVGHKTRLKATDYGSITAENQQEVLLRRRRKAIAVFEKDMLATIESNQRLAAKRFVNNLKRSEMLLKEHESTKRTLFAKHSQTSSLEETSPRIIEATQSRHKSRSSSFSRSRSSEPETSKTLEHNEINQNRAFSAKLKQLNDKVDVPYVKLSSYTKEDLKRPSTSLELKRKAWEKVSKHLEENRSLRPASASFVARCERNVPRNVREAREKLREITKVRLLAQLPPAPPRIDVGKVLAARREAERVEKHVVREFCQSLGDLKVVLPSKFCWMDANEVYLRNSKLQQGKDAELPTQDCNVSQHKSSVRRERTQRKEEYDVKTRRRHKGQLK